VNLEQQLASAAQRVLDAQTPLKVLAAEDNPVFQSMLRAMLTKWGYQAVTARDGNEAWEALQAEDGPRLAVLDWMMPGLDGVEVCRRVRATPRQSYVYLILLTARTESQDLVEGMDAGADDYLTKPFEAHELRVRLRAGRRILDLQQQLLAAQEAMRVQATHDCLTRFLNHGAILESLDKELARSSREHQPMAVLMTDLDHFKTINDTHGHQCGDAVLREAAERIRSAIRNYDIVGRYGGEEFLLVLPGCQGSDAQAHAERIREALASRPFSACGNALPVTCSVGVSYRSAPTPADAGSLIHEADMALYTAKRSGRNQVAMATVMA
jgi:two-component system, cell cycle response regulator